MHLSQSQVTSYLLCGEYYRREKIEGEFLGLTTVSAARGTGVHQGARANFGQKKETRVDLPRNEIVEISAEAFDDRINNTEGFGFWLSPPEKKIGRKKVVGSEKDRTVRLAGLFSDKMAPEIQPDKVEAKGEVQITEDLSFLGFIDLIESKVVRDLKTSAKSKNQNETHQDFQLTSYAVLYRASEGEWPVALAHDVLIDTKTPKFQSLITYRDEGDAQAWLEIVVAVYNQIQAGIFPPAMLGSWKCLSMDTEIATLQGWKTYEDLVFADRVLTLNQESGACEWRRPLAMMAYKHGKPMVRYESKSANFCVTPEHQMFYRTKGTDFDHGWHTREAETLVGKEALLRTAGDNFNQDVEVTPYGAIPEDSCELCGWVAAEGHFRPDGGMIEIAQKRGTKGHGRIKELLHLHKIEFSTNYLKKSDLDVFRMRASAGRAFRIIQPDKNIPEWLWRASKRQVMAWTKGFLEGDGHRTKKGWTVGQKSERFIDELQILCAANGMRAVKGDEQTSSTGGKYFPLSITNRRQVNIGTHDKVELADPEEYVWDITVPNHLFLVRRGGRAHFTHNCSEKWCPAWGSCRYVSKSANRRLAGV